MAPVARRRGGSEAKPSPYDPALTPLKETVAVIRAAISARRPDMSDRRYTRMIDTFFGRLARAQTEAREYAELRGMVKPDGNLDESYPFVGNVVAHLTELSRIDLEDPNSEADWNSVYSHMRAIEAYLNPPPRPSDPGVTEGDLPTETGSASSAGESAGGRRRKTRRAPKSRKTRSRKNECIRS